jgi:hypothetical protein
MASSSSSPPVPQADAFPDGTTDYVPVRKKNYDSRKPHITEFPITWSNWYQHVNWLNTTFIIFIPLAGLVSSYWVPLRWETGLFAVAYYFFAGLGISEFAYLPLLDDQTLTDTILQLPVTIACGPILATRPLSLSRSSLLPAAPLPSRVALGGGPAFIALTTATPTPTRIPTRSGRVCSTATLGGWS